MNFDFLPDKLFVCVFAPLFIAILVVILYAVQTMLTSNPKPAEVAHDNYIRCVEAETKLAKKNGTYLDVKYCEAILAPFKQ